MQMGACMKILIGIDYVDFREIIDRILSGLVYKEGYKDEQSDFLYIIDRLHRYLDKENMYLPNALILEFLLKQKKVRSVLTSYEIKLVKDKFSRSLSTGLVNYVKVHEREVTRFLQEEGYLDVYDLEVPSSLNKVVDLVYSISLSAFDDIKELNVELSDALDYTEELKVELQQKYYMDRVRIHGEIFTDTYKLGKDILVGYDGVVQFDEYFNRLIKYKFDDDEDKLITPITNHAEYKEAKSKDKDYRLLFQWGIPEIDSEYAFYSSEISTIVANPGLGKTNTAIDLSMKARLAGLDVIFIHGESLQKKIRDSSVCWYMNWKYNKKMNYREVDSEDLSSDMQTLYDITAKELADDPKIGNIYLVKYLDVETYRDTLLDLEKTIKEKNKREYGIDKGPELVILDHINDMGSNGERTTSGYLYTSKDKIDYLYRQTKEMKKDTSMSFIYLSHPSSEAKKLMQRDIPPLDVDITGDSSHGDKDSDTVIYLRDNTALRDKRLFIAGFKKVRDGDIVRLGETVLEKQFVCSTVVYREENQVHISLDDFDILE